jgi:broad specificity phosphatase PhoE
MIRAWIENRYSDYSGESWSAFRSRVESIIPSTSLDGSRRTIAVVTSATPIAILTAVALGLSDEKMLSVLGLLYNSGVTTMRIQNGGLRLFTLNATPHLPDSIRTFR